MEIDFHKLMFHPDKIYKWMVKGDSTPIYIEMGLTNRCNHKCFFCALDYMENGKDDLDSKVVFSSLDEMSKMNVKSIMFAGEGEPLLHKNVADFVQYSKKKKIDVAINTNGIFLKGKKMEGILPYTSWIRVSIDSGSSENYSLIHGTNPRDFEKVIKNLEEAVHFKRKNNLKSTIGTQFLVTNKNIGEAEKLAGMLKEIGVDNLQIKPYSHHPDSLNDFTVDSEYYLSLENLNSFNDDNFKIIFRKETKQRIDNPQTYKTCLGLSFFTLIDARGNVIPCNLYYNNEDFTYGNLYEKSFKEIWEGDKRKVILERIKEKGIENCRRGCRLDAQNRYLHRLKNPLEHDNFI